MGLHFPKIRLDGHSAGNFLKNIAPALAFTPAGVLGAGALAAVGGLARGEKVGQALKSGVSNAVIGGGAASLAGKVGLGSGAHLGFGLGAPAAPTPEIHTGALPGPSTMASGELPGVASSGGLADSTIAGTPGNFAGKALGAGGKLLDFAEAHPNAASGALQGLGSLASSGPENRLRNDQADLLEKQATETEYDFQQRKARDAALAPIWGALGTRAGQGVSGSGIAANPYAPKVG